MNEDQLEKLREQVDTIVRDEAYNGDFGPLSEDTFNKMAANIASLVVASVQAIQ
ncbi:hypothetical protein SEA_DEJAVU_84 [Microbacterium Phage DejaVu]|nr:hypothetical protein LUPINE_83 [Microbacterium phage Lupine]QDK03327.1 hypothetical protein SEA_ROMAN_86 [Microbacterium phage Roman]QIG58627.1 hypothetical protein SEA_HUBBS_82 [Microbacterium phage Hubbs]WNM66216.1 hypothetical protein SEA_DEJAVU_84 [Microbacterium Phage DejaVu]